MGRRKIDIVLIANEKNRKNTFEKRRKGIEKKIKELSALSGSDALLLVLPRETNAAPSFYYAGNRSADEWPLLVDEFTQFQQGQISFHPNPARRPGRPSKQAKAEEVKSEAVVRFQLEPTPDFQKLIELNIETFFICKHIQCSPRSLKICPRIL